MYKAVKILRLPIIFSLILLPGCTSKTSKTTITREVEQEITRESATSNSLVYEKILKAIETDDFTTFKKLNMNVQPDTMLPGHNDDSYSILGYCCEYKRCQWVEYLLSRGINSDPAYADEYFMYDALYITVPKEDICTTKLLLESGADPNRRYNEEGLTALFMSCRTGNYELSELLIEHNADVNGPGYTEGTDYVFYPLMAAVESANIDLVKLLLNKGARPGIIDRQGMTPIKLAKTDEMKEILSAYMDNPDVSCRDSIYDMGSAQICTFNSASFEEAYSDIILRDLVYNTELLLPSLPEADRVIVVGRNGLIEVSYTITPDEDKILMFYEGGETLIRIWNEGGKVCRGIFHYAD